MKPNKTHYKLVWLCNGMRLESRFDTREAMQAEAKLHDACAGYEYTFDGGGKLLKSKQVMVNVEWPLKAVL